MEKIPCKNTMNLRERKHLSIPACGLAALIMATAVAVTAFGAEDRKKIDKVQLSFDSSITRGSTDTTIEISTSSSQYSIEGYDVLNMPDDKWTNHDCPRVEVYLQADDDYYFKSSGTSYVKVTGDGEDVVSVERDDDNSSLSVIVDLKPIDPTTVGNPAGLEWSSNGIAKWSKAYKAKEYKVELYRDEKLISSETTTKLSCDFSAKMTEQGNYYFQVRAVSSKSNYSDWVESDAYSGSGSGSGSSGPASSSGEWVQDATGWWFKRTNGSYPAAAWEQIKGYWYYFNASGYMITGLQNINEKIYYLDESGAMRTGWQPINNQWRYFGTDGAMLTNTTTPDGFQVGADGVWIQ